MNTTSDYLVVTVLIPCILLSDSSVPWSYIATNIIFYKVMVVMMMMLMMMMLTMMMKMMMMMMMIMVIMMMMMMMKVIKSCTMWWIYTCIIIAHLTKLWFYCNYALPNLVLSPEFSQELHLTVTIGDLFLRISQMFTEP